MTGFLPFVAFAAGVIVSAIVAVILKPFLIAYAQEKGKNLATKEDLQSLVTQVSAVTEAT